MSTLINLIARPGDIVRNSSGYTHTIQNVDTEGNRFDTYGKMLSNSTGWTIRERNFQVGEDKYYMTTLGIKVGPMKASRATPGEFITQSHPGRYWRISGNRLIDPDIVGHIVYEVSATPLTIEIGGFYKDEAGNTYGPMKQSTHGFDQFVAHDEYGEERLGNKQGKRVLSDGPKNLVEKVGGPSVTVLKLEKGKFYKTQSGDIVGPMELHPTDPDILIAQLPSHHTAHWNLDGTRRFDPRSSTNIIEEALALEYGEWKIWNGGQAPDTNGKLVQIQMRGDNRSNSELTNVTDVGKLRWSHQGIIGDIIAYREKLGPVVVTKTKLVSVEVTYIDGVAQPVTLTEADLAA